MPEAGIVSVGPLEELEVGRFHMVDAGAAEIGVIRLTDDSVHAIRNACPHKGAPICQGDVSGTMLPSAPGTLEYGLDGAIVRCPWHSFEFELASGREPFSGHNLRLIRYAVTVRDGRVYLDTRRPLRAARDRP